MKRLLIALVALAFWSAAIAQATPRTTAAIAAYKKLQREQALFKRRVGALSTGEKIEVKTFIEGSSSSNAPGADPDNDGLDSETEEALGSNSCDSDSDDDGQNDGDDDYEDDDDGVYAEGTIASIASRVVTVGTTAFIINDSTVFRGRGFSEDDLVSGMCVEIEGYASGADNIAQKIKREKASECNGGDGDDD